MTIWTPDEIEALRRRLGYTQQDLALAIKCHPSTVSRWEAGSSPVRDRYLKMMLQCLSVSHDPPLPQSSNP